MCFAAAAEVAAAARRQGTDWRYSSNYYSWAREDRSGPMSSPWQITPLPRHASRKAVFHAQTQLTLLSEPPYVARRGTVERSVAPSPSPYTTMYLGLESVSVRLRRVLSERISVSGRIHRISYYYSPHIIIVKMQQKGFRRTGSVAHYHDSAMPLSFLLQIAKVGLSNDLFCLF